MYAIHTTPGFIIESRPRGESDRVLSIFTRDLGLVRAVALSIRLERSKLRYHSQEYSFGVFSLVRGREVWRLTSAAPADDRDTSAHELTARLAVLLRRLLQGEEANPRLFECVEACTRFLAAHPDTTEAQLKTLESVTVLRILHALGYIGDDAALGGPALSADISLEILESLAGTREEMNQHINKALRESHL